MNYIESRHLDHEKHLASMKTPAQSKMVMKETPPELDEVKKTFLTICKVKKPPKTNGTRHSKQKTLSYSPELRFTKLHRGRKYNHSELIMQL